MSERWARVRAVLDGAIADRVTPGASLCAAARRGDAWTWHSVTRGTLSWEGPDPVTEATVYDLASLTKPFTAWAAVRLSEARALDLSAPLSSLLPAALGTAPGRCSLDDLLCHRAGMASWRPLYQWTDPDDPGRPAVRAALIDEVLREDAAPCERAVYSDLGYILAGEALAAAAGRGLDEVMRAADVLGALRFRCVNTAGCAPTERCPWRGRVLRGEVHDENCYALGGVTGHAGLFGDARSVCERGVAMVDALREGEAWAGEMLRPRAGGTHRRGWDTRSPSGSSAGERMGPRTFGHLGFTGTSLWCDPDAVVVIALLTNRVHPTRDGDGIRALRPGLHDAVMDALSR